MNAMAVRAKHDRVRDRVQATLRLGLAMMNIASGFGPSAALALIAKVPDYSLCPSGSVLVAALASVDRVALAIVPRAMAPQTGLRSLTTQAAAQPSARLALEIVRLNDLLGAAIALAAPKDMPATVDAYGFNSYKPAVAVPSQRLEVAWRCPCDRGGFNAAAYAEVSHALGSCRQGPKARLERLESAAAGLSRIASVNSGGWKPLLR